MAVQQNGNVGPARNMKDLGSSTLPRSGAAKRPQTSFATTKGMTNQTSMSGIAPGTSGTGPDASSPNPADPEPSNRVLRKQPDVLQSKWGMTDADGKGIDNSLGDRVLSEGKLPVDPYV